MAVWCTSTLDSAVPGKLFEMACPLPIHPERLIDLTQERQRATKSKRNNHLLRIKVQNFETANDSDITTHLTQNFAHIHSSMQFVNLVSLSLPFLLFYS